MATSASDSDSDYGYDFTAEEEELLADIVDGLSRSVQAPPVPLAPAVAPPSTSAPNNSPPPSLLAALQGLTEDDLAFDIGELEPDFAPTHYIAQPSKVPSPPDIARNDVAGPSKRSLSPSIAGDHEVGLASYVSKVKAHRTPTVVSPTDVCYPDISRALSSVIGASESLKPEDHSSQNPLENKRSPLRRFRTFPQKPFSVSDLTAGSWCELQYFYTLTRLPGGKKTRTVAMKRGSDIHEKLEREVYTPVEVEISKKVDVFGLKIWNIIQGLRILRDTGLTRELEVWGVVDGNVVNGIIDGLSYRNPDPELEDDVISSRGDSQSPPNSQQPKLFSEFFPTGTPADKLVYITDVKTRASMSPPSKPQVRGTIIQLFLYHRFLSEMASGKLDYISTFERYGLDPDDTFSDVFMAQIGALRDEIFGSSEKDSDTSGSCCSDTSDSEGDTEIVSAVSSSSKLKVGLEDNTQDPSETLKYRTLRALIPLLKFEIQLTFPKGANSVGQIVAVEYRYRQRGRANSDEGESNGERKNGSVICTNTHFVEPEILDLYLKDDMQWWRGEREPRGVSLDEAFKCRSCEFVDTCEWRDNLDQEALRKARKKGEARIRKKEGTPPTW